MGWGQEGVGWGGGVSAKPGLCTGLDWTMDWTGLDWTDIWTQIWTVVSDDHFQL